VNHHLRARGAVRGLLALSVAAASTGAGAGMAHAGGLESVPVLRTAAVFGNLDSLSPPIVATLEPGRDVAYPFCRHGETAMVFVRYGPSGTLPTPDAVGYTYSDALGAHAALPPC
jgi:hypothetical protein